MTVSTITTVPGARPVVELGVGNTNVPTGQAVWGTARWDTDDSWSGVEPTWLDITCDVHDVEIDAGRDRTIARWQVGTASITLDNMSGRFDVNVAPVSPATLSVRPGRQIRVGVSLDGGDPHWLGRWWIDAANPTYDPVLHDVVELACVDAKGMAGKVDVAEVADPGVGASETVSARINRVLDAAAWQTGYRDIQAGSTTLQATKLGAKAVDLIDLAADSAGGVVFGDSRAMVVYRGRDWQTYEPDQPPDDTIGNLPPVAGSDIVWTAPAPPPAPTDVLLEPFNNFTTAPWTTSGGPTIVAAGRTGNGVQVGNFESLYFNIPAPSQTDTLTCGTAFKLTTALTSQRQIFRFASDSGATDHNNVVVNSNGSISVSGQSFIGLGNSAIGLVVINTWYYLEVQIKLHDTAGTVLVRLNGAEVLNLTNQDTKNGGTKTVYDRLVIPTPNTSTGGTKIMDDLYLGTAADAVFHGPITIPPGPPAPPSGGGVTEDVTFDGDQLTWMGGTVADAVCPSGWEMSFEAADMATRVLVGRPQEPPHVFDDTGAQLLYGLETFTRTDLIPAVSADLDVLGARYLRVLSADFMPNVAAVTIDAATSTEARNLAATVDPTKPSRFRGYLREGTRVVFDRQFLAVGVSHRIDPESWTVRVALDDAGPFAVVGNRWDDAAWNTGIWSEPPAELLAEARTLYTELVGANG